MLRINIYMFTHTCCARTWPGPTTI